MPDPSRPGGLTAALLEPAPAAGDLRAAVEMIPAALAALAARQPDHQRLRVTDYDIRCALSPAPRPDDTVPFAWSVDTTRRALGLAAMRALAAGEARTPAEGVRMEVDRAVLVVDGRRPVSTMDRWLAHQTPAGRAAVQAAAVTWATRLWSAVDWQALDVPLVIGRDHWWESPHSSLLAVRGRADVRLRPPRPGDGGGSVHLVVLRGTRRTTVRAELSVVGLVEALRMPKGPVPGRIVGWWPDSGHVVRVDMNRAAIEDGFKTLARTMTASGVAGPEARRVPTAAARRPRGTAAAAVA